jgi:uncharacterized protein (DUF362 family)
MDEHEVVISRAAEATYPSKPPFHPDQAYPEAIFEGAVGTEPNAAYRAVREALILAGLDQPRIGTRDWNPLGAWIHPGQFVLIKPNLITAVHPRDPHGWRYTMTHGSIIRAVADFVWKALDGRGRVTLADAPQTDAAFARIVSVLGLDQIGSFYADRGLAFEVVDLRPEVWRAHEDVIVERQRQAGDPAGYVAFDLADRSEFEGHYGAGRYYGADYDAGEVNRHHTRGRHEYLISGSVIDCDVFVNIPKLKTHKKAGVTVNLKNLVGVNGDKNWLPHHTIGYPENGGDQYPEATIRRRIEHAGATVLRAAALRIPTLGTWMLRHARRTGASVFGETSRVVRSGNWHGNDTTWRMCLDLNKVVLYGNRDGSIRAPEPSSRKPFLSFVDGIIAGQGNGPIDPDPAPTGLVLFGTNPVPVDAAAALLMGFDPDRIPITRQAYRARDLPLTTVRPGNLRLLSNHPAWNGGEADLRAATDRFRLRPHFAWTGHIECCP